MKKLLSLILALVMVLSLSSAALAEVNGELPLFKEKEVLTIGVRTHPNVVDFNTNSQTLWLEELANVDLQFEVYSNEMNTQITMAITGGNELPDILFTDGVSADLLYQWAQAGAIIPLDEYFEKYSCYTLDAIERTNTDFLSMMKSADGKLYTLPTYNQSLTNEYMDRIWFYTPWLEKLNLEVPTNAEELYTVLKAFKEQDPNGNGEADEIPLMGHTAAPEGESWWRSILNMFVYWPKNGYSVKDGVVSYTAISDEYREGLKYIRKLFDEGLVDPMSFTAEEAQLKALVASEPHVVGMTVGYSQECAQEFTNDWVLASPFKNAEGNMQLTYHVSVPYVSTLITSYCKNPEAAFRFCDLLYRADVAIVNHWGIEGVHWNLPAEGDVSSYYFMGFEPTFREDVQVWATVQNECWYQSGNWVRAKEVASGRVVPLTEEQKYTNEVKQLQRQLDYVNSYPTADKYIPMLSYTAEETEMTALMRADLESYMATARTAFMLNKDGMDIYSDEAWEAYLNQCKRIGLEVVTETMQAAYDRMYK